MLESGWLASQGEGFILANDRTLERKQLGLGSKPALVVVDVVKGFTNPDCALGSECADVVAANVRLMHEFHQRQLPIFLTTVIYRHHNQARVFRDRLPALELLVPDSRWIEFDPQLPIVDSDVVIEKVHASSFHGTSLQEQLVDLKVDSLVVTGLTTSGCVRATVVDGLQNGFPVVVPEQAVGDRNSSAHRSNLYDLNAKYADVVDLDTAIGLLP